MNPVTTVLQVDIGKPTPLVVHAKQGESLSRKLYMQLYRDGNRASIIPSSGTVEYWVRYTKPDGTYGLYSLLPDNETPAVEATPDVHGDQLAVTLAPQVLTCAGDVHLSVSIVAENVIFSTFAVLIIVEKAESITTTSDNWFNCPTLENIVRMVGDLASLQTTDKSNTVAAINELLGMIGTMSNLDTTVTTSLVDAINEVLSNIGALDNLTTAEKTSIIAAINDLLDKLGDLSDLDTTAKTTLVAAINELVSAIGDLTDDVDAVKALTIDENESIVDVPLTYRGGYFTHTVGETATFVSELNRACATVSTSPGDKYLLTTRIGSNTIAGIIYTDANGVVLSYDLLGTGHGVTDYPDYETTAPAGAAFLIVASADGRTAYRPRLKKREATAGAKFYNKEESDARYLRNEEFRSFETRIAQLQDLVLSDTETTETVELTIQAGGYYTYAVGQTPTFVEDVYRACAIATVNAGDKHLLSTRIGSNTVAGIIYLNAYGKVISYDLLGSGWGVVDYSDYETVAPENAAQLIVQTADNRTAYLPTLKKCTTVLTAKAYNKAESDARYKPMSASDGVMRYGVKYAVNDPTDTGARCFDAVGKTATIGIGSTAGSSDFDSIYPWSEIKRCNIKTNAAGAKIVTFEGESGFALDGSNGDVFVRIPKFSFERYTDDGYEYIVISDSAKAVHPAFVENGNVLDEIFIGAFEGKISSNKLRSVGGVIPSSNQTGAAFLSAAVANGSGYSLYDMRCVSAIWALMAVEFGCRNSNSIFGYGASDFLQPIATYASLSAATATNSITVSKLSPVPLYNLVVGSNITICSGTQANVIAERKLLSVESDETTTTLTFAGDPIDLTTECFVGSAALSANWCEDAPAGALSWHTGRAGWVTGSGATVQNPMRYRWVENVFGNLWHFMPDVRFNDGQMYQAKNIAEYNLGATIPEGYSPVGAAYPTQTENGSKADTANTNYWVDKLSDNHFAAGITFGAGYSRALTSAQAFGAHYYLDNDGVNNIVNGGGFDHLYRCNILTHRAWIRPNNKWYLYGARLMYKDIPRDAGKSTSSAQRSIAHVTLAYNAWTETDGSYYQTVNVSELSNVDDDEHILLQASPATGSIPAWDAYKVKLVSASVGTMTFKADSAPAENESINVIVVIWR